MPFEFRLVCCVLCAGLCAHSYPTPLCRQSEYCGHSAALLRLETPRGRSRSEPSHQRCRLIEHWQHHITRFRWQAQHDPVDAGIAISLQDLLVPRAAEYVEGERRGISPGVFRHLAELRQYLERIDAAADRYPAIAIGDRPLGGVWKGAADDDRRVRLLHRLRPLHHLVELDELAREFRLGPRPDLLHRQDALAHQFEARLEDGAV